VTVIDIWDMIKTHRWADIKLEDRFGDRVKAETQVMPSLGFYAKLHNQLCFMNAGSSAA
jgi:hypothetical protein